MMRAAQVALTIGNCYRCIVSEGMITFSTPILLLDPLLYCYFDLNLVRLRQLPFTKIIKAVIY